MSPEALPDEELWRELAAASGCSLQEVRNMQSQERRDMIQICLTNVSNQGPPKRFRADLAEVQGSTGLATLELEEGTTGYKTSKETNATESRVHGWCQEGSLKKNVYETNNSEMKKTEASEIPKEGREKTKVLGLLGIDKQLLAVHREHGREAEDERHVPLFCSRKRETARPSTSPINHDAFRAQIGKIKSMGLFHSGVAGAVQWQRLSVGKRGCSAAHPSGTGPSATRTQEEQDMELARKLEDEEEGRVRPPTRQQTVKDWGPGKILGTMAPSGGAAGGITSSSFYGLTSSNNPWSRQSKESDLSAFAIKFIDDSEADAIQDTRKKDKCKRKVKKLGPLKSQFMDD